ncbi:cytochrome P450 [Saccharothrix sp. S26]|uniref:cytochrome P450 n=1 Tax=Saccharothrix sp. S26 TaxID=2907215 RepID=UPI001F2B631C|nr:cytochrome P450 [Saccharothrix sp. S26]MCE7001091.1 cytochrome P450 [Saccharothrix sp. S26]
MTTTRHENLEHALLLGGELHGYRHHEVEDAARRAGPAHLAVQPNGVRVHVATLGLEAARGLLADERLSKDALGVAGAMRQHMVEAGVEPNVSAIIGGSMINADPPDHARLRRPVAATLTPRRVEALRDKVTAITRELLDGLDPDGPADVVAGLALPLPLTVICELLGVPGQDQAMLAAWSSAMMTEVPEQQQPASEAMVGYLAALIDEKRARPDDALLSALVHVDVEGDRLAPDEVLTTAVLMIAAGHETTTAGIGNTLAALLHTEQWSAAAASPDAVPDVVRESLRFDPPTRNIPHYLVREPIDLGDHVTLPAGALTMVNLGSANRDPEAFGPDAHRFVPFRPRPARSHLTFGNGWHRCVGSALATMEIEIAVRETLVRWPRARPAVPVDRLVRNPHVVINGFARLDVVLAG